MKKKTHPAGKAGPIAVSRARRRVSGAPSGGLAARIERLEALEEIRMLAAKYSLSLDMRDLDAHVNLFAAGHPRRPRARRPRTPEDLGRRHAAPPVHRHLPSPGRPHHRIHRRDACPRSGLFQERARDRQRLGDHADALLGRLRAHPRPLVFSASAAVLLVRHRPQQARRWAPQDALARTRAVRGQLARAVAVVEAILGRSRGARRGRGRSARPARGVPEDACAAARRTRGSGCAEDDRGWRHCCSPCSSGA